MTVALTGTQRSESVRDRRIERLVPLVSPLELIEQLPLGEEHADVLVRGRSEVQAVLDGTDDRLLVVVGPCSVHDVGATREYAERLSAQVTRLGTDLCVAMRVYFEKPRTTVGWNPTPVTALAPVAIACCQLRTFADTSDPPMAM